MAVSLSDEARELSWRAVVLYGLNTATYKLALARCLGRFVREGTDHVPMLALAEAFLDLYRERLQTGRPQLLLPGRLTVMERIVALHQVGSIGREHAVARVARDAFADVVPRFHTVGDVSVPIRFYEHSNEGLALTDATFELFTGPDAVDLDAEIGSRWDLLEAAFEMKRHGGGLGNDIRAIYLERGHQRRSVTYLRPVLHGYQQGRCFYCGEVIGETNGHVDHVIPRQFLQHDEPWNLVLAHGLCNEQKSDALPGDRYIAKLVERNEHLIASNHPLKRHLIMQLGTTPDKRRRAVQRTYADATHVIPYTWEGLRGLDLGMDPLYQAIVRSLMR